MRSFLEIADQNLLVENFKLTNFLKLSNEEAYVFRFITIDDKIITIKFDPHFTVYNLIDLKEFTFNDTKINKEVKINYKYGEGNDFIDFDMHPDSTDFSIKEVLSHNDSYLEIIIYRDKLKLTETILIYDNLVGSRKEVILNKIIIRIKDITLHKILKTIK